MPLPHVKRGGTYYRGLGPMSAWSGTPDDTSYSKNSGGRWNPRGEFGALYLGASVEVAYANGLKILAEMLAPATTPDDVDAPSIIEAQEFTIVESQSVDAVTDQGRAALKLTRDSAKGTGYDRTQAIAREAYANDENGIACVSAVEANGEELAIFDSHAGALAKIKGNRVKFTALLAASAEAKKRPASAKTRRP